MEKIAEDSPDILSNEWTILDYWNILWNGRYWIGGLSLSAALIAMSISMNTPKIYKSTVTLLPLGKTSASGDLPASLQTLRRLGFPLSAFPIASKPVLSALFGSRVMSLDVVEYHKLVRHYQVLTRLAAANKLKSVVQLGSNAVGLSTISVSDTDPYKAADLANFYVRNLDRRSRQLDEVQARRQRQFIERRLSETTLRLHEAEEEFKIFQIQNKALAVPVQSSMMMHAAANIEGKILGQEIKLETLRSYLSPGNQELVQEELLLESLKNQLYILESGEEGKGMLPGDRLHPAMITVPELALDFERLQRNLATQVTLYNLLSAQHDQAKLVESRNTPTVEILDSAVANRSPVNVKIKRDIALGGGVGFLISLVLVFFFEYWKVARSAV